MASRGDAVSATALMFGLNGSSGKGKKKFCMGLIALEG